MADWISERDWQAWDEQIGRDLSPGGRGTPLLAELEREIAEGKTTPMAQASPNYPVLPVHTATSFPLGSLK